MTGRYRVDPEPLGTGGMATVHRAEVTSGEGFRRPVAVKYIHEALASRADFEAQFRAEARLISLLRHPNVVQVLDFDRDRQGRLFLVMELVEGTDLRRIRDFGPLPVGLAVYVVAEVLKGLVYAHAARDEEGRAIGFVHRDLSPQNVLASWDGALKITDFGIAQGAGGSTTKTGVVKGNAGYMSPEQIDGHAVDARSDVFAVGVLLHELLIGAPLYARPDRPTRSILAQILLGRAKPPAELRPEVPPELSSFVMGLLAHDPADRPPSAEAALRSLLSLECLPATAALDFVQHLKAVRRATEKPTVLDEEPPKDVALATSPMPALDTVALDTQPQIVPIEGIDRGTAPRWWLPVLTIGLGVLVVVLSGLLVWPRTPRTPKPVGRVVAPVREAQAVESEAPVTEQALGPSDAGTVSRPAPVRAGRRATTTARQRRAAPLPPRMEVAPKAEEPARKAAAAPRPDVGTAPELLPYEPAGLLPYEDVSDGE